MIIIIDGLDNVGKTTQIEKLRTYFYEKYFFHVIHYSVLRNIKDKNVHKDYSKKLYRKMFELIRNSYKNNTDLIFDRAHLGEMVYGKIYRNYEGDYIYDIENEYKDLMDKIYLFVLVDKPENLIKRDDNKSFSINMQDKVFEKERFRLAFEKSNIKNKLWIDINSQNKNQNENEVFNIILEYLK